MSKIADQKLMKAMSFNEKDISMNRQLKLSEKQKHKLKPVVDANLTLSFLSTTVFFSIAFAALFTGFGSFLSVVGVLGFGLCFFWAFRSVQWLNQLKKYQGVKFVEGKPEFDTSYKNKSTANREIIQIPVYSMKIGHIKFYLDEETYDSIFGLEIRVYYFQTLKKQILSIETTN